VAKGNGNAWYTGNSPGHAISIFFSDSQGGAFYKSVLLEEATGVPTDITVSRDGKWLAVIYVYNSEGYMAVYSIDKYGDLTYVATSPSSASLPITISGVAFSE
jgi:6-phosphogluconolactonase (cycloisomerase 2 family)